MARPAGAISVIDLPSLGPVQRACLWAGFLWVCGIFARAIEFVTEGAGGEFAVTNIQVVSVNRNASLVPHMEMLTT
jgi:hypothetical protein